MSELAERNRELLAERLCWPDGALDACRKIEASYPGVEAAWFAANVTPGFEREPGFYAWEAGQKAGETRYVAGKPVWVRRREWYGATAELLDAGLADDGF